MIVIVFVTIFIIYLYFFYKNIDNFCDVDDKISMSLNELDEIVYNLNDELLPSDDINDIGTKCDIPDINKAIKKLKKKLGCEGFTNYNSQMEKDFLNLDDTEVNISNLNKDIQSLKDSIEVKIQDKETFANLDDPNLNNLSGQTSNLSMVSNDNLLNNLDSINNDKNLKSYIKDIVQSINTKQLLKNDGNPSCRFYPSFSQNYTCPEKYPSLLGASFSAKAGSGISCNNKKLESDRAKAYAIVRNGRVDKIKLINKGSGYGSAPKVKIRGSGNGAKAKASIDKYGSISSIKLLHKGQNYSSSPSISIEKPNGLVHCHMCCKF